MSFKDLYERRQDLPEYVSRNDIIQLVREITRKPVVVIAQGMNTNIIRGLFVPVNSNHPLTVTCGGSNIIIVARENNRCWTRLVIFKEAMHLFDGDLEQTSNPDELEELINEFVVGTPEPSAMMRSEEKALWMGMSLMMRESDRIANGKAYHNGEKTGIEIAEKFKMPKQIIPHIFGRHYKSIIQNLIRDN